MNLRHFLSLCVSALTFHRSQLPPNALLHNDLTKDGLRAKTQLQNIAFPASPPGECHQPFGDVLSSSRACGYTLSFIPFMCKGRGNSMQWTSSFDFQLVLLQDWFETHAACACAELNMTGIGLLNSTTHMQPPYSRLGQPTCDTDALNFHGTLDVSDSDIRTYVDGLVDGFGFARYRQFSVKQLCTLRLLQDRVWIGLRLLWRRSGRNEFASLFLLSFAALFSDEYCPCGKQHNFCAVRSTCIWLLRGLLVAFLVVSHIFDHILGPLCCFPFWAIHHAVMLKTWVHDFPQQLWGQMRMQWWKCKRWIRVYCKSVLYLALAIIIAAGIGACIGFSCSAAVKPTQSMSVSGSNFRTKPCLLQVAQLYDRCAFPGFRCHIGLPWGRALIV